MTRDQIQSLMTDSSCLARCLSFKQLMSASIVLINNGAVGGVEAGEQLVTEDGDGLDTEDGDNLVTE